jgi:hypothetical protein
MSYKHRHAAEQALIRRRQALETYRHNLHLGRACVRGMIVADIARFADLGAHRHAGELANVLVQFDSAGSSRPRMAETA